MDTGPRHGIKCPSACHYASDWFSGPFSRIKILKLAEVKVFGGFQRAIVGQLSCRDGQLLLSLAWAQTANHGFSISFASPGQLAIGLDNLFLNLWAVNPVSCATRLKLSVGFSSPDPGTLPQRGVLAWESILVT